MGLSLDVFANGWMLSVVYMKQEFALNLRNLDTNSTFLYTTKPLDVL